MRLIGIIGQPLAGKHFASEYLRTKHGAASVVMSDILKDILTILKIPAGRQSMSALSKNLRGAFGESILLPPSISRAKLTGSDLVVVDGLRKASEVKDLRSSGYPVYILNVTADAEVRYSRYLTRGEKSDEGQQSFEEFVKTSEVYESERDVQEIGKLADATVTNNGEAGELYRQIEEHLGSYIQS